MFAWQLYESGESIGPVEPVEPPVLPDAQFIRFFMRKPRGPRSMLDS